MRTYLWLASISEQQNKLPYLYAPQQQIHNNFLASLQQPLQSVYTANEI